MWKDDATTIILRIISKEMATNVKKTLSWLRGPAGLGFAKTLPEIHKTFEVPQVHFIEKDTVDVHVALQQEMLVFRKFRNRGIPTSRYTELAVRFSRYRVRVRKELPYLLPKKFGTKM